MSGPGIIGVAGSVVLVIGAMLPDRAVPRASLSYKNWCFGAGAIVMLAYAVANWLQGASVFFVFLEGLMAVASACMLFDVPDRVDVPLMIVFSGLLIAWSLALRTERETLAFVGGLAGIAVGYVMQPGTARREIALLLGSALIAAFSLRTQAWVFFWLNLFFAAFSAFHAWKAWQTRVLHGKKG